MHLRFTSRRSRALLVVGALAVGLVAAGCDPEPPPPPPPAPLVCDPPADSYWAGVVVMGPCSQVSVDQVVDWWNRQPHPTYRASVPITDLVTMYLEEGQAEGVRGDLAFMQSVIETGWFSFGGRVPPEANNFSGLGATDGTSSYATFPDARTGVRAQIQHLRAYADATATSCAEPPLHNACVDPRFDLVSPKGKAPTWNQFGNGVWAIDPGYSFKILVLYDTLLAPLGKPLA
jgi:hypothetical protein